MLFRSSKTKAFECGGIDYIPKPFHQAELLSRIKVHLDLKKTQNRLLQSSKMEALGKLTSGIAHELKNPLNFIYNFSKLNLQTLEELLILVNNSKEKFPGDVYDQLNTLVTDLEDNTREIHENGIRVNTLLQNMLGHGRKVFSIREENDINGILKESLLLSHNVLNLKFPNFQVTVNENYGEKIPRIKIQRSELTRVFCNIMDNAFYAMYDKNGKNSEYEPEMTITTKYVRKEITTTISDNGSGIKKAILDKIFDPFYTTKPPGEGTGMGLKLCYEIIVEQMGGKISCDSEEGKGTTFTITLPVPES